VTDYRNSAAPVIRDFLNYHEVVRDHSVNTVDAYYSDIKLFIGWIHLQERPNDESALNDESITVEQLAAIRKLDVYEYLTWLNRDRKLDAATRARRLSSLRALYRYLVVTTNQLDTDPTLGVIPPKLPKHLPVYLNESQAERLLDAPDGTFEVRDRTILMLFMTCGLRISEMANLDLDRVYGDSIRVLGKGNKERIVYLSKTMQMQLRAYLDIRYGLSPVKGHEKALFLSRLNKRMSVRRIRSMVDEKLSAAGLDSRTYSPHKLRHTAATLMLQNGVDVRVLMDILGHERLDTTQIYTHCSNDDLQTAARTMEKLGKKKE